MKRYISLLLLLLPFIAHGQVIATNELRMKARSRPPAMTGTYRIVVNTATGELTCVTPSGGECLPTGGGGGGGTFGLVLPTIFGSSNNPATTGSNLTVTLANQAIRTVFAGPVSGSSAAPTFRLLDPLDIPGVDASKITSGTIPLARGGTGVTTAPDHNVLVGNGTGWLVSALCNGVLQYNSATRTFTCPTIPIATGPNTWTGIQTFNPNTTPQNAILLDIAPVTSAGWLDSHSIMLTGTASDGLTTYIPQWRLRTDVASTIGASAFTLANRSTSGGLFTEFWRIDDKHRMIMSPFTTDPSCIAGQYWIGPSDNTSTWRKCEDGVITDMDTGGGGGTSTVVQVGGSPITTQSPVNFIDGTLIDFTNPTGGSIRADFTGQLALSKTAVASQWLKSYDAATGAFTSTQPLYSELSGLPVLPVTITTLANNPLSSYDSTTGLFTRATVAYSGLTGLPTLAGTLTCSGTDKFSAYNATTGLFVCSTDASGAGTTTFNVNGSALTTQSPVNFQSGTLITATNPSSGNVAFNFTGVMPVTKASVGGQWLKSYDATTGVYTSTQPNFTDLAGAATTAQLPAAIDFTTKTSTQPVKAGLTSATPSSCVANKELYIKTDATAGKQQFLCNSSGTGWNLLGDGGGYASIVENVSDITSTKQIIAPAYATNDTVNNSQLDFAAGSGGNSTCPAALAAHSYVCYRNSQLEMSVNGAAYSRVTVATDVPATATALAANPTDCSAGQYAKAIDASGNLTCEAPTISTLSGTNFTGATPFTMDGATVDANKMSISLADPTTGRTLSIANADSVVPVVKASATTDAFITHISSNGTQNTAIPSTMAVAMDTTWSAVTGTGAVADMMTISMPNPGAGKCIRLQISFRHPTGTASTAINYAFGSASSGTWSTTAISLATGVGQVITVCNDEATTSAQHIYAGIAWNTAGSQNLSGQNFTATEAWGSGNVNFKVQFNVAATDTWSGVTAFGEWLR